MKQIQPETNIKQKINYFKQLINFNKTLIKHQVHCNNNKKVDFWAQINLQH